MSRKDELTIEPYSAPGLYEGEPAYTYMGQQVLVAHTDLLGDDQLLARVRVTDATARQFNPAMAERNVHAQVAVQRILNDLQKSIAKE